MKKNKANRGLNASNRVIALMVFLFAFSWSSCEESETVEKDPTGAQSEAQARYSSLYTLDYSILRQYVKKSRTQGAHIRYPICVAANFSSTSAQRQAFADMEERAVNRWNQALIGEPEWPVQSIELYLVGGSTPNSCPTEDNGYPVYRIFAVEGRGSAVFWDYINNVESQFFRSPHYQRELHEYGHQIGLGDTYTEPGYEQPIGQPAGIMNNCFEVNDITQDDIASIRQVWRMIRTNSSDPCGPGYTEGQAIENRNNHNFCVKLNGGEPSDDICTDSNNSCEYWASRGECTKNPGFMLTNCCASCESTGNHTGGDSSCTDSNQFCADWASRGECTKNPGYMLTNCCASCKGTGSNTGGGGGDSSCTDSNQFCADWASRGECTKNPDYMLTNCCASCRR